MRFEGEEGIRIFKKKMKKLAIFRCLRMKHGAFGKKSEIPLCFNGLMLFCKISNCSLENVRVAVKQEVLIDLANFSEFQIAAFDIAIIDAMFLPVMQLGVVKIFQVTLTHLTIHIKQFSYAVDIFDAIEILFDKCEMRS